jgi:hypothetical protein
MQEFGFLDTAQYDDIEDNELQSNRCMAPRHSSMRWVIMRCVRVAQILENLDRSDRISDCTFEAFCMKCSQTSSGNKRKQQESKLGLAWSVHAV